MHRIIPSTAPETGNFADLVLRHAELQPWVTALEVGGANPSTLDFGQLGRAVQGFRRFCRDQGWQKGSPVVVMHKPEPGLYVAVLGLLAEGLIPVFIDNGLGPRRMLRALRMSGARQVLTSDKARRIGPLLTPGSGIRWHVLDDVLRQSGEDEALTPGVAMSASDHGLISYTSGTTGRPKGADRTHDSLIAQHQAIRDHWPDERDDIDMTCLPVLVLHNLCCGMPSVMPDMDFAAPARADGRKLIQQIKASRVTRISGAPAFISRIADRVEAARPPESIRSIRIGGAPVGSKLAQRLGKAFPKADIAVVYGSTEAEPIAHLEASALLNDAAPGYPVGRPVPQTDLLLVRPDSPIGDEAQLRSMAVSPGETGEVVVAGPHVLKGYVNDEQATRENKIPGDKGRVWHRTGDLAVMDEAGQLRLLGRSGDQIRWKGQVLPTFGLERRIQDMALVKQAALVQARPGTRPHLFLSLEGGGLRAERIEKQCRSLLAEAGLAGTAVVVLKTLPVDSRHNSKIQRAPLKKRCRS